MVEAEVVKVRQKSSNSYSLQKFIIQIVIAGMDARQPSTTIPKTKFDTLSQSPAHVTLFSLSTRRQENHRV
jgi:hypothetical protein